MKTKMNYLIIKDDKNKTTSYFEGDFSGYDLAKTKKKVINGINVSKMMIVNQSFIEKVINKKVEKKFKALLELVASVSEGDEDPSSAMMFALNEIEKFRRMIINQYASYMTKKQMELLDKKVKLVENEIKMKMYQYTERIDQKEEELEKSSHRRR